MNWETYIAFGDSITIGARSYLGYPEYTGSLLKKELNKDWNVINHATSGFTSMDLARSINSDFNNLKGFAASISTVLIGTNDIKTNTTLALFEIALDQVLLKAKLLTTNKNIIVIKIPEFTKGIMYPYTIDMNTVVQKFNEIVCNQVKQHKLRVFDFGLGDNHTYDGVHLNDAGVEHCGKQLAQYILKDKGLSFTVK